jgi:hypothetical protein
LSPPPPRELCSAAATDALANDLFLRFGSTGMVIWTKVGETDGLLYVSADCAMSSSYATRKK